MKLTIIIAGLAFSTVAQATDQYVETLSSTGTSAQTGDLAQGGRYAVQCSGTAARVRSCQGSCTAVADDVLIGVDVLFDVPLRSSHTRIAIIRNGSSGTSTCRVYTVIP